MKFNEYLNEKPINNKLKKGWYVYNEYHEEYPLYGPYKTQAEAERVAKKYDGWALESDGK